MLVMSAFLLAFVFAMLYRYGNKYTAGPPYGKEGLFQFTEAQLNQGRPLFLIDGWEIYPDVLLSPGEISEQDDYLVTFIGQYSNYTHIGQSPSPFGKAAYRMKLLYEGAEQGVVLEIPEIFTEYTLWINGRKFASTGDTTIVFETAPEIELLLQL